MTRLGALKAARRIMAARLPDFAKGYEMKTKRDARGCMLVLRRKADGARTAIVSPTWEACLRRLQAPRGVT